MSSIVFAIANFKTSLRKFDTIYGFIATKKPIPRYKILSTLPEGPVLFPGYVFYPITSIALLEWLNCIMFLDEVKVATDLCVTMCIIPLLINAFLEYKFVCLVLLLRQRFRVINEALIPYTRKAFDYPSKMEVESFSQKPDVRYQRLKETLKLASRAHAQLCLAGVLLNKAFSVQILLSIGNAFVGFTAQAYYCCEGFIQMYLGTHDGDTYGLATTTIWVIVEMLILLKLSVVCAITTDEVSCRNCGKYRCSTFELTF